MSRFVAAAKLQGLIRAKQLRPSAVHDQLSAHLISSSSWPSSDMVEASDKAAGIGMPPRP